MSIGLNIQPSPPCAAMRSVLDANWIGSSTIPAHGLYPHQWSWDTAFISYGHAISNTSRARIELESLFAAQWSNGLLPHIVFNPSVPDDAYFPGADYWRSSEAAPGRAPAKPQTSGIVNPPVHASAVLNLLERDPTAATHDFAKRMYAKLAKWMRYLHRDRDPDGNGLLFIRHPWESGMDNSPAWDAALSRMVVPRGSIPPYNRTDLHHADPKDRPSDETYDRFVWLMICARNRSYMDAAISGPTGCPFIIEDVLFNAVYAQAASDMAELARRTAQPKGQAPRWEDTARKTLHALATTRWDANLSMYLDFDMRLNAPIRDRVVSGLSPLLLSPATLARLGVDEDEMHIPPLLATLRGAGFGSGTAPFGVPSLDVRDKRFTSRCYWRGPAWYNTDWLLWRGVRSRAEQEFAQLNATLRGLIETHGAREYWDPTTGLPHGASAFSWTAALYLDAFCGGRV